MARSIWAGSIGFGLVNIPVRLFTAVAHKEVRFHLLHGKDGARIHQRRVCSAEGEEVPWEETVKGYEISRNRYVPVTREELEALDPRKSRTIEIVDFVDEAQIDPVFYENTYYLMPDRGAAKPYALLREAMRRSGRVAIARMVLRTRESLCALRVREGALAISTLNYADEIVDPRSIEPVPGEEGAPSAREVKMAEELVASLSTEWEPARYRDEYRERVLELLDRKAEGKEIVAPPAEEPRAEVVNLADALRKSLAAARGRPKPAAPARGDRRRAPSRAAHESREKRGA